MYPIMDSTTIKIGNNENKNNVVKILTAAEADDLTTSTSELKSNFGNSKLIYIP